MIFRSGSISQATSAPFLTHIPILACTSASLSLGERSSITKSGQTGAKLDCCAGLRASQRRRSTQAASGLRMEPSGNVNPPLESNAIPRLSASAHSSRSLLIRIFILLVLLLAGDMTRISPLGSRSIWVASLAAQNRSNSSSLIGVSGRNRTGSCSVTIIVVAVFNCRTYPLKNRHSAA